MATLRNAWGVRVDVIINCFIVYKVDGKHVLLSLFESGHYTIDLFDFDFLKLASCVCN